MKKTDLNEPSKRNLERQKIPDPGSRRGTYDSLLWPSPRLKGEQNTQKVQQSAILIELYKTAGVRISGRWQSTVL